MHVNQTLGRSKWTKSLIDRLYGLWTNAGVFTMNRASPAPVDHGTIVAQYDDVAAPARAIWQAKPSPYPGPTGLVWARRILTIDWSNGDH
jgi:hypothetical protein